MPLADALLPLPIAPSNALRAIVWPTLMLLTPRLRSPQAEVMLLATAGQESSLANRYQVVAGRPGVRGPARGLWQFELGSERLGGGVWGVAKHSASAMALRALAAVRRVDPTPLAIWRALEFDDVLACGVARLLLWTDPKPLPPLGDRAGAWNYYLDCWRPGKPHLPRWPRNYDRALAAVTDASTEQP